MLVCMRQKEIAHMPAHLCYLYIIGILLEQTWEFRLDAEQLLEAGEHLNAQQFIILVIFINTGGSSDLATLKILTSSKLHLVGLVTPSIIHTRWTFWNKNSLSDEGNKMLLAEIHSPISCDEPM